MDGGREWAGTCFLVPQAVVLGVGSELRPQLLTFVLVLFPLVYPSHLLLLLVSQEKRLTLRSQKKGPKIPELETAESSDLSDHTHTRTHSGSRKMQCNGPR